TTVLDRLRLNRGMVESGAASFEERTHVIRQPECSENRTHGPGQTCGQMTLRDHEGNILRDAVVSPHVKDVLHQFRFFIKTLPRDAAGMLEWVVLEGNKGQIREMPMRFQVGDEAAHPRGSAACVGPDVNVFVHSLEDRTS